METILRVLNKSNKDTSNVTKPSISYHSFSSFMKLQKSHEIKVKQISSSDNVADLFTKSLPSPTFKKLTYDIGMRRVCDQSS